MELAANMLDMTGAGILPDVSREKELVLSLLEVNQGNITSACQMAGIKRGQFYRWMAEDEAFAEAVDMVKDLIVDMAQARAIDLITAEEPDAPMVRFLLERLGKHRGYGQQPIPQQQPGAGVGIGIRVGANGGNGGNGRGDGASIYVEMGIGGWPPEPKSIEEWEEQVERARRGRKGGGGTTVAHTSVQAAQGEPAPCLPVPAPTPTIVDVDAIEREGVSIHPAHMDPDPET